MLTAKELADRLSVNPDFQNPFRLSTSENAKPAKNAASETRRIWDILLQYYTYQNLPTTLNKLNNMEVGDLRRIASYFKPYSYDEMRDYTKSQLVSFICGYQSDVKRYKNIMPLPFEGLPDLVP